MVLDACEAQKGSLYHFFPGGKDELIAAVVEGISAEATADLKDCIHKAGVLSQAIELHLLHLIERFDRPVSEVGLPFLAMATTLGATNERVRLACMKAIQMLESTYREQLLKEGHGCDSAESLATFLVLAVDGAILLARSRDNSGPLKTASKQLASMLSVGSA
ncbi:putative HTH-type transcriptional regulator YxaF [Mariniblastus fucicola]|uniref:Putative HTH-type transcriptional regulator YxaF n=1 Tax=Mariniblastus fucicola TaxID=980251 RepID=A0A5B9PKZ6_9BACT|nr:putative HTH-type transcriptional regulator YxaF [Mariniblastus fucicola]